MNQRIYIFALLLWLWGGWSHHAHATHSVGAELTYQYVSPNVYRVQLVLYRDCSGLSMATTYQVAFQPSCGAVNPFNLTVSQVGQPTNLLGACGATTTCSGGTAPGFQRYVYQGTVTVPTTCSIWNLTFTDCCRLFCHQQQCPCGGYARYYGGYDERFNHLWLSQSDLFDVYSSERCRY